MITTRKRLGVVFVLTLLGTVLTSGSSFAQITISPESIDLALQPGQEYVETKIVRVPGGAPVTKVDIYFMADTTGSTAPIINQVKANASSVLNAIVTLIPDVRFGVGEYKDFPYDPYCFRNNQAVTDDLLLAEAGINMWFAGGGADGSEGQFFAMDRIAEPSDPYGINFRSGAQKIILWFGDAPAHDPVCAAISGLGYSITESTVTAKLATNRFTVIAIGTTTGYPQALNDDPTWSAVDYVAACGTPGGSSGQADRIAAATGGSSLQNVDPSTIVSAILGAVEAVVSRVTVELVPTGPTAPFTTVLTPPYVDVPLPPEGEFTELTFEVKFTGLPCDPELEEHVFIGGIDALVDDAVGATQSVTIREPSCDIVPLFMDIKPGSCPNSFNRGSEGVLPVSILGTMDFDVAAIDVSSVVITREDGIGGSAAPYFGPKGPRPAYGDLATPFTGMLCGCHELKDDGFMDLCLKFDSQTVVSALQLNDLPAGAMIVLKTTGMLSDGRQFEAKDCIRLVPPHPSKTGAN